MFLAAVAIFTIFGVIVTIHWHLISCWKTFHFLQWSRDTLPHFAAFGRSPWLSTSRSQVRRTLTQQNRLLTGVLLILLHTMSYDFWIPDEHHALQLQSVEEIYGVWGEGFSLSMGVDEGSTMLQLTSELLDTDPKQHGIRPKPTQTAVQKRSFYRACRRAILHGCAWYNGQCMPLHEFPTTLISTVTANMVQDSSPAAPVRSHVRGRSRSQPCIQACGSPPSEVRGKDRSFIF